MKPLFVLTGTFILLTIIIRLYRKQFDHAAAARIALSVMLLFTALGHFLFAEGMSKMIPAFVPLKQEMVYLTGILEIIAAVGLQIKKLRVLTGRLLILFFLIVLPANVNATIMEINYQTGAHDGPGPDYLWFRVPLQFVFIGWTYFCSFYHNKPHQTD